MKKLRHCRPMQYCGLGLGAYPKKRGIGSELAVL